jgi:hypothetical protein
MEEYLQQFHSLMCQKVRIGNALEAPSADSVLVSHLAQVQPRKDKLEGETKAMYQNSNVSYTPYIIVYW